MKTRLCCSSLAGYRHTAREESRIWSMFQLLHVLWIIQTIVFLIKKYCFECAEWLSKASRIFWPNIVSCSLLKILAFKLGAEVIEKKKKVYIPAACCSKAKQMFGLKLTYISFMSLFSNMEVWKIAFLLSSHLMPSVLCVCACMCVWVCVCLCEDTHTHQQYYRVSVVVLKHVGHIWI